MEPLAAPVHYHRHHPALAGVWAYPLPGPRRVRACLWLLVALIALLMGAWIYASTPLLWQIVWMLAAIVLVAFAIFKLPLWKRGTSLQWTGSKWRLDRGEQGSDADADLADLVVAMDGQRWLLLRTRPALGADAGAVRWLLLLQASSPERWPDIRRVLYSSMTVPHPV